MEIEQLQKIVDSIHIGDFVSYRNHVYEITAFGRNRTTGKHYYVLDGELLVNEDNWNELKLEKMSKPIKAAELRDQFLENFRDLIETAKSLL